MSTQYLLVVILVVLLLSTLLGGVDWRYTGLPGIIIVVILVWLLLRAA